MNEFKLECALGYLQDTVLTTFLGDKGSKGVIPEDLRQCLSLRFTLGYRMGLRELSNKYSKDYPEVASALLNVWDYT